MDATPDYRLAATRAAKKYNVDPKIFLAMIGQESGFDPNARSGAGAQGIAQFIPSTAKAYGVNLNDGRATDDLEGAAKYLRANLDRTNGNYHEALSIYNSGRPDAYKDPSFAKGQTFNYVRSILAAAGHSGAQGAGGAGGHAGSARTVSSTKTVGAVDNSRARGALIASFLEGGSSGLTAGSKAQGLETTDPLAFAQGIGSLKDNPGRKVTTTRTVNGGPAPVSYKGGSAVGSFEGRKVAGWIAPILQYARQHGWKGQVTSGYRSFADQQRIYNSGVRPAAKPGTSNHEFTAFPGGAIDASDAATLSRILRGSPYAKKLVWAGSKDPVHFSHPHNGSY